jgi:hypothetical protein
MTSTLIDRLNGVSEGLAAKVPCRVATTANITLSGEQTIDGVAVVEDDRVLVKNQTDGTENGIYVVSTGNWSRAEDFDGNNDVVQGTRIGIAAGSTYANAQFILTSANPITIDTTSLTFAQTTESTVDAEFAKPETPVDRFTADHTVLLTDLGEVLEFDCSSGNLVCSMISAVTAGDGARVTVRHVGSANAVTIDFDGSEAGDNRTSFALSSRYEAVTLVSDGTNWLSEGYAPALAVRGGLPFFKITDRLTAPPVSPTPGARYILNGTGTGAWSVYSQHDVLEANGQGGWLRYTPTEGWFGYVEDENLYTAFVGTAWSDQTGMPAASSSNLATALFSDQANSGTGGPTASTGAWTQRILDTTERNDITGCSLASNQITLPQGRYIVLAQQPFYQTAEGKIRFKSTTDATNVIYSTAARSATGDATSALAVILGVIVVAGSSEVFELQYYSASAGSLGNAFSGGTEHHAFVEIIDMRSLQGPAGSQGAQGSNGFAGFKFAYSTSVTVPADPGAGILRLNSLTLSSVTSGSIDATSNETGNPDVSDAIASYATGGVLKISKIGAEQNFASYTINSITDNGGYLDLSLTYRDHAGSFSNADAIAVLFVPQGNTGATGSSIPVYDFQFNTATAGDPGSGKILFNNATLSAATAFNISETDRLGTSRAADIATWDDDGSSTHRGYLYGFDISTGARQFQFKITGSLTDNGSYDTLAATYISGSAPANNTRLGLLFVPTGATGLIGGTTGSTDNAYVRNDGVGGTTLQAARATEDDSGKVTVNYEDATTNTVVAAHRITRTTSGTAANGIGVRQEFALENASGATVVAAAIDAITTDTVNATEDADVSIKGIVNGTLTELVRFLSTGVAYLANNAAKIILHAAGGQTLTGGFNATSFSAGTKSSGTFTPDPANGNIQHATNGGAHTLAPPSSTCSMLVEYVNNGSAGAITTSSFDKVVGTFTTTNGHKFHCWITKSQNYSSLIIQALQ